jgi:hypothetical protein
MTTAVSSVEEIYEQRIKALPQEQQIYLLKLIADGLAATIMAAGEKKHSVLEFAGAGAHNPIGMDAQEYVNKLREEWEHRP